jgi:hypothetical protein
LPLKPLVKLLRVSELPQFLDGAGYIYPFLIEVIYTLLDYNIKPGRENMLFDTNEMRAREKKQESHTLVS